MLSAYSREPIRTHINNPYEWNRRPYYGQLRKMPQERCNLVTIAIQQRHAVEDRALAKIASDLERGGRCECECAACRSMMLGAKCGP